MNEDIHVSTDLNGELRMHRPQVRRRTTEITSAKLDDSSPLPAEKTVLSEIDHRRRLGIPNRCIPEIDG